MSFFFRRIFTSVFLLLVLPIMILIYLFLLLHGINPIYKSVRVGKNLKFFTMYKFTTLKHNLLKSYLTTSNDKNFFYFSSFLRNAKLDELPQLLNIIIGHMNWVGPRANDPRLVKKYNQNDKKIIFSIKPGLTDFSTLIYGIKSDNIIITKDEKIYFEKIEKKKIFFRKLYVKRNKFVIDLKIIIYTFLSYISVIKISEKNFKKYF
jgi:lipopolysaccharide/colanic/teichoic acid biosynthesis glycosyltransferase